MPALIEKEEELRKIGNEKNDSSASADAKRAKVDSTASPPFSSTLTHPILAKNKSNGTAQQQQGLFKIQYPKLWQMYKKASSAFWVVEEIEFKSDADDFRKLNANEQQFLKVVLAFFAQSDGIVLENLDINFSQEVNCVEVKSFYAIQEAIEAIHSETYSVLIETLVDDIQERKTLFDALANFDVIRRKSEWAMKWMDPASCPFAQRVSAFAMIEGVFFSGSFAAIYWIKQRGILDGLCFSNELISRDEGMHYEFACMLFREICPAPNAAEKQIIFDMVQEAVQIESDFFEHALPCSMIGMNKKLMVQYIKFVADRLLHELMREVLYGVDNPFSFMDNIGVEGKTNFFERRVGEYQKVGVKIPTDEAFETDAAF